MHKFYISDVLLPIPPSALKISIEDKDEEIELANGGTMTVLNQPGLTTYSFEFRIPNIKYPFATYSNGFLEAPAFLSILSTLKTNQQPFTFKVIRGDKYVDYRDINTTVSLVDYTITEDAENNGDYMVEIELKEYMKYATFVLGNVDDDVIVVEPTVDREIIYITEETDINYYMGANDYKIEKGDTFQLISKKRFGHMNYAEAIAEHNQMTYTTDELMEGLVINLAEEPIKAIAKKKDEENREKQEEDFTEPTESTGLSLLVESFADLLPGQVVGDAITNGWNNLKGFLGF